MHENLKLCVHLKMKDNIQPIDKGIIERWSLEYKIRTFAFVNSSVSRT